MTIKKNNCELCGRKEERLAYSYVEGVKMQVCSGCVKFGKFAGEIKIPSKNEERKSGFKVDRKLESQESEQEEEVVVSDYAKLIHVKREKLGLSQRDFAMKLNEKESFIANLENGKIPLGIDQARKLEKLLGLNLISREKVVHLGKSEKSNVVTIGDTLLNKLGKKQE